MKATVPVEPAAAALYFKHTLNRLGVCHLDGADQVVGHHRGEHLGK